MANPQHIQILEKGVAVWNDWRQQDPDVVPNLEKANVTEKELPRIDLSNAALEDAYLRNSDLSEANLSGARLTGADLFRTVLCGADLIKASLHEASLRETNLFKAKLNGANLSWAELADTDCRQANLDGANLIHAHMVRVDFEKATLTNCRVYGIAAWDLNLSGAIQANLIITSRGEHTITVGNLEVAQFLYLLLSNRKIRDVIDTITTKVVLILGPFAPPECKVILDAIRDQLPKHDYAPVMFDFDKPATRDTQETIVTLVGLARFVIADITNGRSVPQELVSAVEKFPSVPVQPLLKIGSSPWGLYDHIEQFRSVLPIVHYKNVYCARSQTVVLY
jgi:uncharacterized protein YjbI with pentapeptide repeats